MKILNLEDYPNFLDLISLTDKDIIHQIVEFELDFINIRDKKVEWEISLPKFVTPFYNFIKEFNTIPDQSVYWLNYKIENESFFNENQFDKETLNAIQARIYRTYPSLVRDIHFSLLLKKKMDCKVIYNEKLDIEEGIDILLIKDNKFLGINCFTDTEIARIGRNKKSYKHENFGNIKYIDLPVTISGAKSSGKFYLYGLSEIYKLEELI